MKGGIIGSQLSPIRIGAVPVLFGWKTGYIVFNNFYCQYIFTTWNKYIRNIKFPPDKCAINASQIMTIQVNFCLPVDAIKIEVHLFAFVRSGCCKYITIPEIGIEIRIRYRKLVITKIRIRQS